ncbi:MULTISPECIES: hypothetical protein [unclassified Rathayibacter]|uniref:hypothetical protein n=1 Tax=unclassified Rathayibacter TaxID=2609250 RepID=UPI0011CDC720|nr:MULTISPECIES: hypothetical protein [unclassified Rathayibacter]
MAGALIAETSAGGGSSIRETTSNANLVENNGRQDLLVTSVKAPRHVGLLQFPGDAMPQRLIAAMNDARLATYVDEWARAASLAPADVSRPAIAALYAWQVSLSSAWYETLAYTEAVVRNAVDRALREWNLRQGRSENWLDDAATPLSGLVKKTAGATSYRANQASLRRASTHPRHGAPVTFDDRVAQLEFGSLVHLFPVDPPARRALRGSGLSGRENLWIHGIAAAFPGLTPDVTKSWQPHLPSGLPTAVEDGYAVGLALERLRRLRNRVGHHEQTFRVQHARRLKDTTLLLRGINPGAALALKDLDRVRRVPALRPHA